MSRPDVPADFTAFRGLLQAWNREVIFSRAAKRPGEWQTERNFAGATEFVDPERVQGTLEKGFEILCAAGSVEARAALAMFLVAEVHPFGDGNGRTARLAMNHYLSSAGLTRIIVPTVYRDDYLTALKALTQSRATEAAFPNAAPYTAMLSRAAAFSRWLDCSDAGVLFDQLAASNALRRSFEAKLVFG
jgi:fido (protein-threonine AMPylation protein)